MTGHNMVVNVAKDKHGNILHYYTCQKCGILVSLRLNHCPMCHERITGRKKEKPYD